MEDYATLVGLPTFDGDSQFVPCLTYQPRGPSRTKRTAQVG